MHQSNNEDLLLSDLAASILYNTNIERNIKTFVNEMQIYNAGIKEIRTKLEILDDEFKTNYDYNPIHHIDSRLKSPKSILNKMRKKGLPLTYTLIKKNVKDIAGVRVICNYIEDIYKISELLIKQDDIKLIRKRDYIKNPKESGYRSLHLVVTVPIFLSEDTMNIPVEIQIRTIAMDFWASLEHRLKYKSNNEVSERLRGKLKICAENISNIDMEMQIIQKELFIHGN